MINKQKRNVKKRNFENIANKVTISTAFNAKGLNVKKLKIKKIEKNASVTKWPTTAIQRQILIP